MQKQNKITADAEAPVEQGSPAEAEETVDPAQGYLSRIAELESRLSEAEEERRERERELSCLNLLADAGLPSGLAPAVMASENMAGAVELIRGAVAATVEAEITRRCRSEAPSMGSRAPMTKEELMRLPVAEIQRRRNLGSAIQ